MSHDDLKGSDRQAIDLGRAPGVKDLPSHVL